MSELLHSRLLEVLEYSPTSGLFRWKVKRGRQSAGSIAGTLTHDRIQIHVDGLIYRAHRLAWFYVTGSWPQTEIDHKDGVPSNNVFSNLRQCGRSLNLQNQRSSHRDSHTGRLGVSRSKKRFRARIKHDGKEVHLGVFDTAETAYAAYVFAKRQLHDGNTL